jgi:hypothetical protein
MTPNKLLAQGGYSYLTEDGLLAQGSVPPTNVALPFDTIVLAAQEHQFQMPEFTGEVIYAPLNDSGPPPTLAERELIKQTASRVARRIRAERRVLVTCHQGRNRSGVIAGLALVELGLPGPRAAERIKRIRNGLTNRYFHEMVVEGRRP